tara:strand:+ start:3956 stop:5863 length:1908 start_codon:yes stop_codon:yes gene_type:complete
MPRIDGELSEEELEQVVGGSKTTSVFMTRLHHLIQEEVAIKIPALLKPREELNPQLWDENKKLKSEIRDRLIDIAEKFIKPTLGSSAEIKDITFTGSLANYNYTDLSDIDLHILIDFKEVNSNEELVRGYFNAVKSLWNSMHDIKIKGFEVEVYVQDDKEPHTSSGVYSVMNDRWKKEPEKTESDIDEDSVATKADSLMAQIDAAIELSDRGEHEAAHERAISLRDKLKKLRKSGLETNGEYSVENLAFKTLRNTGYLTKLADLKRDSYDAMMSIDEKKKKKKKKKKSGGDRCTRIAKRKYDVWPSAYASGAVVKCRQGKIWKGVKEGLDLTDSEVETLKKIKSQLKSSAKKHAKVAQMSTDSSELHKKQVDQIDKLVKETDDVRDTYGDEVVNSNAASRKRGMKTLLQTEQELEEKKKAAKTDYSKEKKSGLHGWFQRQGGKGKSKGWVDCNTCRKDKKTGKKKCKSCGRQKGEKRSKYPACRPTPASCGTRGKGKKWGKKSEGFDVRLTNDFLNNIIAEEVENITETYYHITDATYDDGTIAEDVEFWDDVLEEAEYRGRKVKLNKPMRGDVKKFKVFVKDPKTGNVKKVNYGDPNMRIKKSNPKRRKSFRARHNCKNPGPKTKARYWSCRKW